MFPDTPERILGFRSTTLSVYKTFLTALLSKVMRLSTFFMALAGVKVAIDFVLLQLGNHLLCSQNKERRGQDVKAGLFNLSACAFDGDH